MTTPLPPDLPPDPAAPDPAAPDPARDPAAQKPLSVRERRFLDELAVDGRMAVAARRAGCPPRSACEQGRQMLRRPHVAAVWQRMQAEMAARAKEDRERLLNELRTEAFFDAGDVFEFTRCGVRLRPGKEIPPEARRAIVGIKVKHYPGRTKSTPTGSKAPRATREPYELIEFKLVDKVRAQELLMRTYQMLVERHEHTGKNGGPIETLTVTLTEDERLARVRELIATAAARKNGTGT
jgi:phage terminase small subunit